MNADALLSSIMQCGADHAARIRQEQIVLNKQFREICEKNQCGMYGRCWVCPPDAGEIGPLMGCVRDFDAGILYQTITPLEDSFDIEGMQNAAHRHALLAQRIEKTVDAPAGRTFHMGPGGCHLCACCTKPEGKPCRFPGKALLPLEVCGVDVYNTAKSTPLKYINGQNTVTYFGLLLYREG